MANNVNSRKQRVQRSTTKNIDNQYVSAMFEEFISEKEALGLTSDTIKAYRTTYNKFSNDLGVQVERAGDITSSLFPEWANMMRNAGLSTASVNHHLGGIRPFMYWCMEDIRQYLPYFRIRLVKRQEEPPKDYSMEEVLKLLKKPLKKAKFTEWRSWAVCNFIIGTGARVGTIVEILMRDIDLEQGTVYYRHTKNKKLQTANMPPQLVKALREYIDEWRTVNVGEDDYLFSSLSNDKLSKAALRAGFADYTATRGVHKTSIHGLRHTFAREWYLNGGDIVQLAKVLGHSSIKMSEHYMNVYANTAKDRFIQFNPLENIMHNRGKPTQGVKRTD